MRICSSTGSSTTSRDTALLRGLWNGWETKLRLYLSVDHRSYSDLHDIAEEHERLAAVALQGDTDGFRRQLSQHFASALGPRTAGAGKGSHKNSIRPPLSVQTSPPASTRDTEPPAFS